MKNIIDFSGQTMSSFHSVRGESVYHLLNKLFLVFVFCGVVLFAPQSGQAEDYIFLNQGPTFTASTNGLDATLSWTAVSGATGYRLYFAPYPYNGPSTLASIDLGSITGQTYTLFDGASYIAAIKAYNENGESGFSNIELITIESNVDNGLTWGDFAVTGLAYEDVSDWDQVVQDVFGSGYRVADWTDLEAFYSNGGSLADLMNGLGLTDYEDGGFVYRNGSKNYSSIRYYFISRHNHSLPTNYTYLAHDNIDSYMVSLGSWYTTKPILAVKTNISSPAISNSTLNGNYITAGFEQENSINAFLLDIYANGNGSLTITEIENTANDNKSGSDTYSISPDGTFSAAGGSKRGAVSADGNIFMVVETSPDDEELGVGIRKSSGLSNATLNGEYILCQFAHDKGGQNDIKLQSTVSSTTFNGSGGGTFSTILNSNGSMDSGNISYQVQGDGSVSLDGGQSIGTVSSDGNILNLWESDPNHPSMMVGIKKSSGWTDSDLTGTYTVGVLWGRGSSDVWTTREEFKFLGNGQAEVPTLASSKGTHIGETQIVQYSVANDGTLELWGSSSGIKGIISPDGNTFVIAVTQDEDLQLLVGVKQP